MGDVVIKSVGPVPEKTIVDSLNRKLVLRELSMLEEQDYLTALGPDVCTNQLVLGRAMIMARIASIDGVPIPVPRNNMQYRAMIGLVGREGTAAVILHIDTEFTDAAEPSEVDRAKNLPGTPAQEA